MAIQKPEWFKMDPAKFLSDVQVDGMSTAELGACFRLLCRQWLDGHIPDDLHLLARLCRLDATGMDEAWVTLSQFFPVVEPGKRANRAQPANAGMKLENNPMPHPLGHLCHTQCKTRADQSRAEQRRERGPPLPPQNALPRSRKIFTPKIPITRWLLSWA